MKKLKLNAKLFLGKDVLTKLKNELTIKVQAGRIVHTGQRHYTCPSDCGFGTTNGATEDINACTK